MAYLDRVANEDDSEGEIAAAAVSFPNLGPLDTRAGSEQLDRRRHAAAPGQKCFERPKWPKNANQPKQLLQSKKAGRASNKHKADKKYDFIHFFEKKLSLLQIINMTFFKNDCLLL